MESPVFGMGYESFCRNAYVLKAIPESNLYQFYQKKGGKINFTAHGTLFQVFASGGVVGVMLWVMVIGYAILLLLFDLIKNKRVLNVPVIISIMSFHTYGIFQSMQYVPMIWCIIFLNLGYALTLDGGVLPGKLRGWIGVGKKAAVVLVVIGFFAYLWNFESRCLAEKYKRCAWTLAEDNGRFAGFFEHWRWNYGDYRWFGKRGAVSVPGGGKVELAFYCRTPGLRKSPVVLTVSHEGRVLDKVVFSGDVEKKKGKKKGKGQLVRRKYELPVTPGEDQELFLAVSRTWIPDEVLRNFDRRSLGVGVKVIE